MISPTRVVWRWLFRRRIGKAASEQCRVNVVLSKIKDTWTSNMYLPDVRLAPLRAGPRGESFAAEPIAEITLPGTRVFPESITSTAEAP